ncbi:MAG: Fic family protein [Deltaproteobacteria bacterium]|nr:Fic family protein [Deltaproteobacteria bacterium]
MGSILDADLDDLEALVVTRELLGLIAKVDELKGRWSALGTLAPERLGALKKVATIESVGSSTRIEGATLSDVEVGRLLRGLDVRSFRSRDEEEVAGYARAMELVFDSYTEMPLTENLIKHLHQVLLQFASKDRRHRGEYKKLPNDVQAFGPDGTPIGVVFRTATPFSTPRRMQALTSTTAAALADGRDHPLLVIGVFVLRFLAIHPFQDGNGRLSRILTTLLLLRAGYLYVPYSSLERVIEENKEGYYLALRHAQHDRGRLGEWLVFFLRALRRQQEVLVTRVERERLMDPMPELQERLLALAREHGRLTVRAATAALEANRETVKANIGKLVDKRLLVLRGKGKGAWYEPA